MRSAVPIRLLLLLLVPLLAMPSPRCARAGDAPPTRLDLAALPNDDALARLVWERSPELVEARTRVAGDRATVERSALLPNPTLDASMNTIPLGVTNPPGLDKLDQVPNYAFGVSELIEIGKRGPRQRAAAASLEATVDDVREALRGQWFALLAQIGTVASAQVRVTAMEDLVRDAERLATAEDQRAGQGDVPQLDAERAHLDAAHLRSTLEQERQALATALLECSRTAGVPCERFAGAEQAQRFLESHLAMVPAAAAIADRPDLQALQARARSAEASVQLAHAHAIPDPTVRVGYVYDEFVAAGNQRNSMFVGLSVPLPVFDHGQADANQAAAELDGANRARELLAAQAEHDVARLGPQVQELLRHSRDLHEHSLPLAQRVVGQLQKSIGAGGGGLQDLLLARRTLGELLLETAEADRAALEGTLALARASGVTPDVPGDLATSDRS
ncbi:TolC family protein [Candidatus Binatia bacterium]|nr:TolC family protein [Candidatus Binatia bacterium]